MNVDQDSTFAEMEGQLFVYIFWKNMTALCLHFLGVRTPKVASHGNVLMDTSLALMECIVKTLMNVKN